ncbi:MAG: hypothetical protein JW763_03610 [candidate division Zixibacteria bacterium]|nr:hypothetical protein [candidate division Zixibacteria bacterium]
MNVAMKENTQVLLWSCLLIVGSLVIFPERLGFTTGTGFFVYTVFEIGYYLLVFYFLRLGTSWLDIFKGAGLTLLYRVMLGTIFGVIISVLYSMSFSVALTLGVSRYFPAILLQIAAAPFVARIWLSIHSENVRPSRQRAVYQQAEHPRVEDTVPGYHKPERAVSTQPFESDSPDTQVTHDTNGFERAVRYLGEHHAVALAAVIDREGLTTAVFRRGDADPDAWAPMSLLFRQAVADVLRRQVTNDGPDRMDITFTQKKLAITRIGDFNLLVLSQQETDDLLGIRITQATDIVKRFISERYGKVLSSRPEEQYVSNT